MFTLLAVAGPAVRHIHQKLRKSGFYQPVQRNWFLDDIDLFGTKREEPVSSLFKRPYGSYGSLLPEIDIRKAINGEYDFVRWLPMENETPVDQVPGTSQQTGSSIVQHCTEKPLGRDGTSAEDFQTADKDGRLLKKAVSFSDDIAVREYDLSMEEREEKKYVKRFNRAREDDHRARQDNHRAREDDHRAREDNADQKCNNSYLKESETETEDKPPKLQAVVNIAETTVDKYLCLPELDMFAEEDLSVAQISERIDNVEKSEVPSTSGLPREYFLPHADADTPRNLEPVVNAADDSGFLEEEDCFALASTGPPASSDDNCVTGEPVSGDTTMDDCFGATEDPYLTTDNVETKQETMETEVNGTAEAGTSECIDLSGYVCTNDENMKPIETELDNSADNDTVEDDDLPDYACASPSSGTKEHSSDNVELENAILNPQFVCDARFKPQPYTADLPYVIQGDRDNGNSDSFLFEGYRKSSDYKPEYVETRRWPRTLEEFFAHNREFKQSLAFSLDYKKDIVTYEQAGTRNTPTTENVPTVADQISFSTAADHNIIERRTPDNESAQEIVTATNSEGHDSEDTEDSTSNNGLSPTITEQSNTEFAEHISKEYTPDATSTPDTAETSPYDEPISVVSKENTNSNMLVSIVKGATDLASDSISSCSSHVHITHQKKEWYNVDHAHHFTESCPSLSAKWNVSQYCQEKRLTQSVNKYFSNATVGNHAETSAFCHINPEGQPEFSTAPYAFSDKYQSNFSKDDWARYKAWENHNMDYTGADASDNIIAKLKLTLSQNADHPHTFLPFNNCQSNSTGIKAKEPRLDNTTTQKEQLFRPIILFCCICLFVLFCFYCMNAWF